MPATGFLNRAYVNTATTGTGTMTLGAAVSGNMLTALQAGGVDGTVYSYVIEEGADMEIGTGTLGGTGTTLTRTVLVSKIGGTVGTTAMTLAGAAKVRIIAAAEDLTALLPTAQTRNRLVNPAMQVSQQNANVAGTATGYYPADQWAKYHVSSAGTLTVQRVQSVTPNGSKDRARITITAADASLTALEYLMFTQNIEGQEVADLQWGAAAAEQIVVRFGFKGPAGTYAVRLGNSADNRSYVALFTIAAPDANTDTEQTVVIAGDTSGTWLTDTGIGITLDIVLACGSTFQGATGWQAGNILGTSGVSNGMATVSDVFEIFDVGLYADPDATGVAPPWEMPEYAAEDSRCKRYFYSLGGNTLFERMGIGQCFSTTQAVVLTVLPVEMRIAPTINVASLALTNATSSAVTVTSVVDSGTTKNTAVAIAVVASGLVAGNATQLVANNSTAGRLNLSARM